MRSGNDELNGYIQNLDLMNFLALIACFISYKKVVHPLLISEEFGVKSSPLYWPQRVHYVRMLYLRSKHEEHVQIKLLSRLWECVFLRLFDVLFLFELWFSRKLSFEELRNLECWIQWLQLAFGAPYPDNHKISAPKIDLSYYGQDLHSHGRKDRRRRRCGKQRQFLNHILLIKLNLHLH